MNKMLCVLLATWHIAGCVMAGSNEPHADSPGSTTPTNGPTLCRDGTAPPCNDR